MNAFHLKAPIEVADLVIVEINENLPIALGGVENVVHISEVDYIVEGENPDIKELKWIFGDVDRKVA